MSKWKIESVDSYCGLRDFEINDIEADYDDFGEKRDHDRENAEDYGCGNMRFDSKPLTKDILDKYGITETEYYEICNDLEDALSFGRCGWCV